jgi:hydroxyacylglutathione hydrolase
MEPVLHAHAFQDNYIWLIRGRSPEHVVIVDPGDADPVFDVLAKQKLTPVAVLCTHHHWDHVGGVDDLWRRYAVPVYGPAHERIPSVTQGLNEGDTVRLAELSIEFRVLDVPGHTAGHIAYVGNDTLLCGDTLFSAGCGRLFEGTPEQLHASLEKLAALPESTKVYCGHEYTLSNLRFALTVEPDNPDTQRHLDWAEARRHDHLPTLPSTIGRERRINPFLRVTQARVREAAEQHSGRTLDTEVDVFAALRRWKDGFRG